MRHKCWHANCDLISDCIVTAGSLLLGISLTNCMSHPSLLLCTLLHQHQKASQCTLIEEAPQFSLDTCLCGMDGMPCACMADRSTCVHILWPTFNLACRYRISMGPLSPLLLLRSALQADDTGTSAFATWKSLHACGVSRLLYIGHVFSPLTLLYIFATLKGCAVAHNEYVTVA